MKRNVENLEKLAERLETIAVNLTGNQWYDQGTWYQSNGCNTYACLAGWTVYNHAGIVGLQEAVAEIEDDLDSPDGVRPLAASLLGLTEDETDIFFSYRWTPKNATVDGWDAWAAAQAVRELAKGASLREVTDDVDEDGFTLYGWQIEESEV